MAVRIRLARHGRLHRPYYRIVALDGRCHREGMTSEILGVYDPLLKEKTITVDLEKVKAWVAKGALISQPLSKLLKHEGYTVPVFTGTAVAKKNERAGIKRKARSKAKAGTKSTPKLVGDKAKYGTASARAVKAHAKAAKVARKSAAAAAAEAAKAAVPAQA